LEFSNSVSRLLRAWPTRSRVYDDVELSAVQFSGLPGNDRPLTRTVTSHLARSLVLARWRHSISFEVRPLPSLPLAEGAACSLKLRQVQPSEYKPPKQYSNRRAAMSAMGQKRTRARELGMSALPTQADMRLAIQKCPLGARRRRWRRFKPSQWARNAERSRLAMPMA
jgi:hypothetical protein